MAFSKRRTAETFEKSAFFTLKLDLCHKIESKMRFHFLHMTWGKLACCAAAILSIGVHFQAWSRKACRIMRHTPEIGLDAQMPMS
jgi:hypothetical protein